MFIRKRILVLDQINHRPKLYKKYFLLNSSTVTWDWMITSLLLVAANIQLLESKQKVIGIKEHPVV